jgi:hypothetical protein
MKRTMMFQVLLLAALVLAGQMPARAQTGPTPQQIQALIASGQERTALSQLNGILQVHPQSGPAWYLTAEAQDAAGNESAARAALAKADQYAPGLPFAQPDKVAALRAHLAAAPAMSGTAMSGTVAGGKGFSPAILVIVGLVVLFLVMRFFRRRRAVMPYGNGYGAGYPGGQGPYPQYPPGGGGGYGMAGSGIGGALLGGLAAGAGLAAGERIIDGLTGNQVGGERTVAPGNVDPGNIGPAPAPDWDDGLSGSPGWDNGSPPDDSGDIDQNSGW